MSSLERWYQIMKILAIDSSSMVASVAIAEDDILVAEYTINYKKTHSQTLLPMIQEISNMVELDIESIDAIAIAGGPGSFTGLRIGSATAKGLGFALEKPIIHIPTIDAMAYNFYGTQNLVCPIMDARRQQVYTGIYTFEEGGFHIIMEQQPISLMELIEKLNAMNRKVMFTGDAIPPYREQIVENMKVPYEFAPVHLNRQRAGAIAALAFVYAAENKFETAAEHKPEYLRLSQAERERKEREQISD